MPLSINTNIASLSAQRSFLNSSQGLETAYERLASGKRINSARDDAAGLGVAVNLESRVSGLNQAVRNTNDGISMVQIAEGAMAEVTSILQRMRDLAVQAGSSGMGSNELGYLDAEATSLAQALDDALDQARFNGVDLISQNGSVSLTFQVGADETDQLTFAIGAMSSGSLSVSSGAITFATGASQFTNASQAIVNIDSALNAVATARASLGAIQSQLESTVRNLSNVAENTAAAAGRIMDTDYAAETANLTKAQILQQAATSVLAQANAQPQNILSLLQ